LALGLAAVLQVATLSATEIIGRLSAGIRIDDPARIVAELESDPRLGDDDLLFVAWTLPLDGTADAEPIGAVRAAGAQPWLRVVLTAGSPIAAHLDRLEVELSELVRLARAAGKGVTFEADWRPETGVVNSKDHAFLIKRAAVAVTGADSGAQFTAGPLPLDPAALQALYAEEVAAYFDLLTLGPGDGVGEAITALGRLDPGKPVVIDALAWPSAPLAEIAASAAAGAAITFLDGGASDAVDLTALKIVARELSGRLARDPYSDPTGAGRAWAFVREDLGLRVVAEKAAGDDRLRLVFSDGQLRSPELVDLATGDVRPVTGVARGDREFVVVVDAAPAAALLRLERPTAAELEGFDEQIEVGGGRQMPVEEILRRLQAFEDDQDRRIRHYQAKRTFSLRFQGRQGSIDASYAGDYFFRDGTFDWVWSDFYVAGVKWRSKKLPKVPLIQPEKVASLPVEIRLAKDYEYRLRGTDVIDGRDCWVIDFKPVTQTAGRSLYQGTVWVDREIYARVRTRAVQVGLEGDVLSNEETYFFSPVDEAGEPAPWSGSSLFLPLRVSGQQVFSILNATLPVEIDTRLTEIRINGEDFDHNREAALASDATMLRDTDDGLRYLNKEKSGERVVETEFDSDRLFLVGGVFWDESVDYPLPLAGVNYLDLDFKGSGTQLNVFFAGLLVAANIADPDLFGSRWNAGANVNGLFYNASDELYRDGVVAAEEEVRRRTGAFNVFVGRPLANFFSLELTYRLQREDFSRATDTDPDFILPQDTFTHRFEAGIDYNRAGYRIGIAGDVNSRSSWQQWGLPDNSEYHPDQKDYQRWRLTFAKSWWLPEFKKVELTFEHLDSANTDRFSGYDFGLFGDSNVAGYQSGLVRAEKADGAHLTVGVNYLELIRVSASADAVWASNRATGLDNELLAGIGLGGTLALPWQLLVNFDVGYAVAGPGKGNFAVRVFFLKLFSGS
jgi:hypothetical protein